MIDPGYVTDKENEFRLRAAECRNHASKASTEELREHYLWLAEMWHELAEARAAFLKLQEPFR
ncbi:MAG TPA: hypothetical protein VH189_07775 [Rhizomicrobium sp.]|nr:hypothetical protein [Rhizomicrobium sp.]